MQDKSVQDAEAVQLHRCLMIKADNEENSGRISRSQSFHGYSSPAMVPQDMADLKQPGGFRRNYLHVQADAQMIPESDRPGIWSARMIDSIHLYQISNLQLFEDYGGKDHSSMLLPEAPQRHLTSSGKVFVAIIKSNVGPGVLYLPLAFANGGYLVSTIGLLAMAYLTTVCTLRLLEVRTRLGGKMTYGETMETVTNSRFGKIAVDASISMLQCGICATYLIFISNLALDVFHPNPIDNKEDRLRVFLSYVAVELIIIVPLCWVRQVARLAFTNIIADVLIAITLIAIAIYEIQFLANPIHDVIPSKIIPVGSFEHIFIFLGTACFVFEGIGLVIPTKDSIREKEKFPKVYRLAMIAIVCMLVVSGFGGYVAFRYPQPSDIVLKDMPNDPFWNTIKIGYALVVIFTFPLQFLPAIRIFEEPIFGKPTTNPPFHRRALKSMYRTSIVLLLALIAVIMRDNLTNFVSFVGAFCGVPLAYIYPVWAHLTMAKDMWGKITDVLLLILGFAVLILSSYLNIKNMISSPQQT